MVISEVMQEIRQNAEKHGFECENIPEKLMLIVSEVAEAMEDYRDEKMTTYLSEKGKPCGFPNELADIVIRVFDLAEYYGIDLETEMRMKMDYNATRPFKHGKIC